MTRLTVLGLLALGPNHGYGLRRVIESWNMDSWADIKYGSIYAALGRLRGQGFVEEVGRDQAGGPARTTYRLTARGREELTHLLRRAWLEPTRHVLVANVALSFFPLSWMPDAPLSGEEIAELLERRHAALEATAAGLRRDLMGSLDGVPLPGLRAVLEDHFEHVVRLVELDRDWSNRLLERVRSGAYYQF